MFRKHHLHNSKGFTIVEILAVVVIVGLLVSFLLPNLGSFTKRSQVGVVESDMRLLRSNLQDHFIDNPGEILSKSRIEEYIGIKTEEISPAGSNPMFYKTPEKKDPWGNPYQIITGDTSELFIILHSFGPNGMNNISLGVIDDSLDDDILTLYYPQP